MSAAHETPTGQGAHNRLRGVWRLIHWGIILNFAAEIGYASWMIFVVIAPPGGGPLGARALSFPIEQMVTRRLYATECWIAISGLALYLALTEIGPRIWTRSES